MSGNAKSLSIQKTKYCQYKLWVVLDRHIKLIAACDNFSDVNTRHKTQDCICNVCTQIYFIFDNRHKKNFSKCVLIVKNKN